VIKLDIIQGKLAWPGWGRLCQMKLTNILALAQIPKRYLNEALELGANLSSIDDKNILYSTNLTF